MKIKAHAKINICLNVVCKRDDGYHELEMIMVPLALHDELSLTLADEDCYTCSDAELVMDETNTVVKAVELMRSTFSLREHFHIHVSKHIPAQAGLAGGSADAAAVMRGIRDYLQLGAKDRATAGVLLTTKTTGTAWETGRRRCPLLHYGNMRTCSGNR